MKRLFFLAVLAMMLCSSTAHIWAQQKTPLMEQIDAALEQARNLGAEKKYTEALKAANDAVEYLPQPVKETYKDYAGICYGVLSWNLTLNKQYAPAAEAAKKALTFATSDAEWIEGNLAHAYLMLGKTQEAEKIYRKHIGKIFGEGEDAQWSQIVLGDFKIMRDAGIDSPEMAKLEQILEQENIKLRNANEQEKIKLRNANEQEKIKLRNANKNKTIDFAIPETKGLSIARVSPNGELLLAITQEDQIQLIDLLSGEVLVNKKNDFISDDIQFTPDSKQVAMLKNVEISYYDLSLDKVIRKQELKIPIEEKSWTRFTFSSDGALIVLLRGGKKEKCYFYDVQKDIVLGENIFRYKANCSPNSDATVVLSADNKFLFLPECNGSQTNRLTFPWPTNYRIIALETLKTGKGKFIEATIIDNKNDIIDISTSNYMFVYEGLILPEKNFFSVTSNAQYHYNKFMDKGKFLDQGTYYPWSMPGEFIRFLPDGQRGLFIYHTDFKVTGRFNHLMVGNISQAIAKISQGISKEISERNKAQKSVEQKNRAYFSKLEAELEAWQKSLKSGDKTNDGLIIKREGDRVLVQPYDGKAADAKWHKISEVLRGIR